MPNHQPDPHPHPKWQHKEQHRRAQHKPSSATDEIGHWIRTGGILAPLLIGEFVKDPDRKWRFIRITSVAAAILSEGLHSRHDCRSRERDRETLEACVMSGAAL